MTHLVITLLIVGSFCALVTYKSYCLVPLKSAGSWGGTVTTIFLFFSRVLLLQQFRARGRGWGRGNFSGNNNSNSGGNNDFQKRNRDEEWDPEYTPKSKKYYLVCVWSTKTCINPPGISGLNVSNPPVYSFMCCFLTRSLWLTTRVCYCSFENGWPVSEMKSWRLVKDPVFHSSAEKAA